MQLRKLRIWLVLDIAVAAAFPTTSTDEPELVPIVHSDCLTSVDVDCARDDNDMSRTVRPLLELS
jgi:hypothetical protein